MKQSTLLLSLLLGSTFACGGSTPPPENAAPASSAPATPADTAAAPATSAAGAASTEPATPASSSPADKHAAAEAKPHEDPNEKHEKDGPIKLDALVPKTAAKTTFPKQTVNDHDCLKDFPWTGKHQADFKTLTDKCGTPTGMLEYTKPHEGRLHIKHDKRDHFQFTVNKGFCYRYFAVADDGIKDIDIIVLKKGAIIAMDHTDHPVAVIDSDKLWCVDDTMDLDFGVEVDGAGAGKYVFGVWTRPK